MKRKPLLLFGLLQAVSCQLKVYMTEDYAKPGARSFEHYPARSKFLCASICAKRGCSTMQYENGELRQTKPSKAKSSYQRLIFIF